MTNLDSAGILSIMRHLILFLLLLLFASPAIAEPSIGLDHLALLSPNYPESDVVQALAKYPAVGFLWRSFGTDLTKVERILDTGKVKILRVHLLNGPGLRNGQLAEYESLYGMKLKDFKSALRSNNPKILKLIETESKDVCEYLAKKYPQVKVLCSPVLEHNLDKEEFFIVSKAATLGSPSSVIIDNPVKASASNLDSTDELHGYPKTAVEIISLDGSEPIAGETPESYAERYPQSKTVFWWTWSMNCRRPGKFIPPRERSECWSLSELGL
jgi:hypothetical protein